MDRDRARALGSLLRSRSQLVTRRLVALDLREQPLQYHSIALLSILFLLDDADDVIWNTVIGWRQVKVSAQRKQPSLVKFQQFCRRSEVNAVSGHDVTPFIRRSDGVSCVAGSLSDVSSVHPLHGVW